MTDAAARPNGDGREGSDPSRPHATHTAPQSAPAEPPHAHAGSELPQARNDAHVPSDRAVAAWEIASVTLSALIAEWVVLALAGANSRVAILTVGLVAFAFMLLSKRVRGETARDLGWRFDNFGRAIGLLSLPMLAMSALLLLAGSLLGSLNFLRWRGGWALVGVPTLGLAWGLIQQYALQAFLNRRAQIVCGAGARSVLLVASVFALAHFPNPALTAATFVGGLVWAAVYQRAPNLPALAVSHALMTWVLVSTLPPELMGGLRVGYKYFD